jgi:filamentous hemagglutinin family protein
MNNQQKLGCLIAGSFAVPFLIVQAQAESIIPDEANGTGTIAPLADNQFKITGGQLSGNNLFHSFSEFGLTQGQIANFDLSSQVQTSQVQNIFARVTGGQVSNINGFLRITGGNVPNLFLMNPAGIIFGANTSLDLPGSFTATTANGIRFGSGTDTWFNASGSNIFSGLNGTPTGLLFSSTQPGSILNQATLAVNSGKAINLAAGTVVTPGELQAKAGAISIVTIPSGVGVESSSYVRFSSPNGVLSLNIPIEPIANPLSASSGTPLQTLLNLGGYTVPTGNGDIITKNLSTASVGNDGFPGGRINLASSGSIITNSLNTFNDIDFNNKSSDDKDGGNISVLAKENININGDIQTFSGVDNDTPGGSAGKLTVESDNGDITIFNKNIDSSIGAVKNFTGIGTFSKGSSVTETGNAGDVTISAPNGAINLFNLEDSSKKQTTTIKAFSLSSGKAGVVKLMAKNTITTGLIEASSQFGPSGTIDINSLTGGVRILTAQNDLINDPQPQSPKPTVAINCESKGDFSLCTKGINSDGIVIIKYGPSQPPFSLTDPSINGAAARFITNNPNSSTSPNPNPEPTPCTVTRTCPTDVDKRLDEESKVAPRKKSENPKVAPTTEESVRFVEQAEEKFTKEYENCLQLERTTSKNIQQIQKELRLAEEKTKLKTVLVYVGFQSPKLIGSMGAQPPSCEKSAPPDNALLKMVVISSSRISPPVSVENKTELVQYKDIQFLAKGFIQELKSDLFGEDYPSQSAELYTLLIDPLKERKLLPTDTNISFIADPQLQSIPFGALYNLKTKKYLIEEHAVSIVPSFSLIQNSSLLGDGRYQSLADSQLWIMGTNFEKEKTRIPKDFFGENPKNLNSLNSLPFSQESSLITRIWNYGSHENRTQTFIDKKFTVEELKPEKRKKIQRLIIHILTHGSFSDSSKNAHLVFVDPNPMKPIQRDEILIKKVTLQDLYKMKLDEPPPEPIELMTLTACESASGDGEAELNFAGAAVKSRVKSVIGSLWQIDYQNNSALMMEFYSQIKDGKTKAEALRNAQLLMLKGNIKIKNNTLILSKPEFKFPVSSRNKDYSRARFWAGMTLIGSPW